VKWETVAADTGARVSTDAPKALPYGSWPSPLTATTIVRAARGLAEVQAAGDDVLWLERRPDEGGRQVLVRRSGDGTTTEVAPPDVNVRTRVHEYGGGSFAARDGVVWYVDFADQRLWRVSPGEAPVPLTALPPTSAAVRFAEPVVSPDGRWLVCVRERHLGDAATDVEHDLVALRADGGTEQEPVALLGGHDFVAAPAFSPDGTQLTCMLWEHPNLPWDDTTVLAGHLDETDGTLGLSSIRRVAGAPDVSESALCPTWAPDGTLYLLADRDGWWQLYREDASGEVVRVCDAELDLGGPRWVGGSTTLRLLDEQHAAVVAIDRAVEQLAIVDVSTGELTALPTLAGTCRGGLAVADGTVVAILGAADRPDAVVRVDPDAGRTEVLHAARELPVDPAWLPTPEPITFPTSDDAVAHALYYRPTNPTCTGPDHERPPLLVMSHGGPTSHVSPRLSLDIAFWTSRGFAVADVNYRGSTGYGRAYREALRGRWGEVDVDDCTAVARWLADRGEVDPTRLAIRGGSAGGFTTLAALTFGDVFTAGASHYGVADLAMLAQDTHKFESRYLDRLIGPYPQAEALYRARSPVHHTDGLSAPMILLQGELDRVVPPEQTEAMVAALDARRIPHAYVRFEDEDHGFRKAENLVRALECELSFFGQVFGFEPADDLATVPVRHLDTGDETTTTSEGDR
jgi:dipeptidyl aminopeptidase/acylaminoacyl peptidase